MPPYVGVMLNGLEMTKVQEPPVWDIPDGLPVYFNVLPIYHTYSLHDQFFQLPQTLYDKLYYRGLVPSLVHQLVHHPRFKTADLSSIKGIVSGAAHLPPQLAA
ncbi:hypothetical protein DEU56DRAFT_272106 [Suillus clintonianus]|uniref:uncharacterized protein n=1 Tax=Suillus clintonianus TaxID=1904413 RepID=UPI001B880406|nr:uncharacterized protein DEU56DRAFT_272106 [Suillus clintonianus]KAG2141964.1 hypothetical protein DEU56DRAFT_272106 [Suillus clintonianus]